MWIPPSILRISLLLSQVLGALAHTIPQHISVESPSIYKNRDASPIVAHVLPSTKPASARSPMFTGTCEDPNFACMLVAQFGAYISNWTDGPPDNPKARNTDTVSFWVHDPRPEYAADAHCVLPSSSGLSAYTDHLVMCDEWPNGYVAFQLFENQLKVHRSWVEAGDRWVGIAESAPTNWTEEAIGGNCPNKTTMAAGTFLYRTAEWALPVHSIMSSADMPSR